MTTFGIQWVAELSYQVSENFIASGFKQSSNQYFYKKEEIRTSWQSSQLKMHSQQVFRLMHHKEFQLWLHQEEKC